MKPESPALTLSREAFDAVIFDLDGVITRTAELHAAAWKTMFDEYLKHRADGQEPFDIDTDYRRYVDGKPRYQGVQSFLESRDIELPYGDPDDDPGRETVCGLGNRKNALFNERLQEGGIEVYESSVELLHDLRERGIRTAIVSSSKNCRAILDAVGIAELFDARVDGVESARLGLKGKPDPDIFLEAARRLGVKPARAIVVEDATAGVQAGRQGGFGCVVGVDRVGHADDLRQSGADIVVEDLAEIEVAQSADQPPSALERFDEIRQALRDKRLALFLDYDGTLTPIVDDPKRARLSEAMRDVLRRLADRCLVAIVSGRDLPDVQCHVAIDGILYAGSHGFDIASPSHRHIEHQKGVSHLPDLDSAEEALKQRLDSVSGCLVERKRFAVAVHYRRVPDAELDEVARTVDEVLEVHPRLRKSGGKKIYELRPDVDWDKGRAVCWLLEKFELDRPDVLPLYIGDDETDEDAFRSLRPRGLGIRVGDDSRPTRAHYTLQDPVEVRQFLERLLRVLREEENDNA